MSDGEFIAYLLELMSVLGPVRARRMFGGEGIFLDGLMIALVGDGTLYLKSDAETDAEFVEEGMEKFSYVKKGKPSFMSYYQAPEAVFDDSEHMRLWGEKAYGAALRAAAKKTGK